jgi:hypothetical protein
MKKSSRVTIAAFLAISVLSSCNQKSSLEVNAASQATNQIVDENESETRIGELVVSNPRARALLGGQTTTAAFMDIENEGAADRLVSASSDGMVVELHSHAMVDGMMQMRKVDAIEVLANEGVELKSGSYHIMLFNAPPSMVAGTNFKLKLKFERAGELELTVPVVQDVGDSAH